MKKALVFSLFVCACGQTQQTQGDTRPECEGALPSALRGDGESLCPDVAPDAYRGFEPNLAAWLSVSDAVFVGTVQRVARVEQPVYLREWDARADEARYAELGAVDDCPTTDSLKHALQIDFVDVETLHGDPVGPTLSIRMGGDSAAEYPGVVMRSGEDHPTDGDGAVYCPGSRVGAAIFRGADGSWHWRYRQFEVVDGVVGLQRINEEAIRDCAVEPLILGIPDAFEGQPFEDLEAAIRDANLALTPEDERAIAARHDDFAGDIARATYLIAQQTYCMPLDTGEAPSSENNRTP